MDKLKNRRVATYEYINRYAGVPYYFDTEKRRDVFGIGKQISKDLPYFLYELKAGDTLDSLALTYYNNPTFWWAIAYFNNILDPFVELSKTRASVKIPNISSIVFENTRGG